MKNSFSRYAFSFLSILALVTYGFFVYAAAPSGGYLVTDHELNPDCAPGDVDCFVVFPTSGGGVYDLYAENPVSGFTTPIATGDNAIALGDLNEATGDWSFAAGVLARATADGSVSLGSETTASGRNSIALNRQTTAAGLNSLAANLGTRAFGMSESVFGSYNTFYSPLGNMDPKDRIFIIGNGSNSGARHNAFTLWNDGSFAFNDDNFQNDLAGQEQAMFYLNFGVHDGLGADSLIKALRIGSSGATQEWDIGSGNVGDRSVAIGFADPLNTFTQIDAPIASGKNSVAVGNSIFARSFGETALGFFNTDYTPGEDGGDLFDTSDRLFVIGNGSSASSRSDAFTILKNGKVGIGYDNFETTMNNDLLQVNGDIRAAGNVFQSSDRRLKDNIHDISYGLNLINQLHPVAYTLKRDGSSQVGFIAQDVQVLVPELVASGDYLAVNYQGFVPILTKAIQELDVKIQAIQAFANAQTPGQKNRQLCVSDDNGETCINRSQLIQLLNSQNIQSPAPVPVPQQEESQAEPEPNSEPAPSPDVVPQETPESSPTPETGA